MCDIRGYGRVSCPRDDLISTLANLSPQLFRGHPAVRNSLIDWGDPPSSLETKVGDSPSIGELWLCLRPHRPSRQEGAEKDSPHEASTKQIHSVIIIWNFWSIAHVVVRLHNSSLDDDNNDKRPFPPSFASWTIRIAGWGK